MRIAISTESASDLSKELIEDNDIKVINYTVILGDEEIEDSEGLPSRIFEYVSKNKKLPKTIAPPINLIPKYKSVITLPLKIKLLIVINPT